MADTKLDWTDIDANELPANVRQAYDAYKAQYRQMKEAKLRFETMAREAIPAPEGMEIKFGYNFGKLGIALAPKSEARAPAKPKQSLADWIAAQQAGGHRS